MKKCLISVLFLMMAGAVVFAGARGQSSGGGAAATSRIGARGSLPLTNKDVTFTVFTNGLTPELTDLSPSANVFSKKVTGETGVKLDFTGTLNAGPEGGERLNLMLSTGTYPEILMGRDILTMANWQYYADQGIIIPMDAYDPMSFPNIKKVFDEFPALNNKMRGSDGKLYALPDINECLHCLYNSGRIWYYLPWMRDNNFQMPQTLDDITTYLRFVRDTDLNKNGKKDEIPMAFKASDLKNFIAYFAKAYMPFVMETTGANWGLAVVNGKITEQYRAAEFRDALRYLNGLYKEGLILPDSFTMDDGQFQTLVAQDNNLVGFIPISWFNRLYDYSVLSPVKGPNGSQYAPNRDPYSYLVANFFITDKNKDPELSLALYDYLVSTNEVQLAALHGPKGVYWDDPLPGTVAIGGGTPVFRPLSLDSTVSNLNVSWGQFIMPSFRTINWYYKGQPGTQVANVQEYIRTGNPALEKVLFDDPSAGEQWWYWVTTMRHVPYKMDESLFLPPMALADADNARVSDIYATLGTYIDRSCVEFINGTRNIETGWTVYLAELDRIGSPERVQILQKYVK
jgi:putative aldouronate transport system substrate-binding protein